MSRPFRAGAGVALFCPGLQPRLVCGAPSGLKRENACPDAATIKENADTIVEESQPGLISGINRSIELLQVITIPSGGHRKLSDWLPHVGPTNRNCEFKANNA